jgi:hypothetical protein
MRQNMLRVGGLIIIIGVLIMFTSGVLMNSILGLYPITASITIRSESINGQPIQGASVSASVYGVLVGSGITNSQGVAVLSCNSNVGVDFTVVASGYVTKTQTLVLNSAATATIFLTPGGGETYVTVRIYTATSEMYKVRGVKITGGAAPASTGEGAYADILCPAGSVTLTFDGSVASMKKNAGWEMMTFGSFTKQIAASSNAVYTVYVPGGSIMDGSPDFNTSGSDFWDFMFGSWVPGVPNWVLVGVMLVLVLRR